MACIYDKVLIQITIYEEICENKVPNTSVNVDCEEKEGEENVDFRGEVALKKIKETDLLDKLT